MKSPLDLATPTVALDVAAAETSRVGARASVVDRLRAQVSRYQSRWVTIIAVVVVLAGQIAEDLADGPTLELGPPTFYLRRWTIIFSVLYMVAISHVVDRTVDGGLAGLRGILRIDDASFQRYSARMVRPGVRRNAVLLAIPAVLVFLLFLVAGSDLPTTNAVTHRPQYLPQDPVSAVVILAEYTVVGWAGLTLVTEAIGRGRALGALSREEFDIDVFDTAPLFPFGTMALAVALAPAGLILILLLGLGQPNSWLGWTIVLLATVASILALLLPLRGIHRQMAKAKQRALATLAGMLSIAYDEATGPAISQSELGRLSERTSTAITLRKAVQEMTTWPFRNTVAFGRAILIASAPLIYAALGQLINVLYIQPLRP